MLTIEGCIGAGKSTTARRVAELLGWGAVLEQTSSHPFLDAFYSDTVLYALETELNFVLIHYHQLHPLGQSAQLVSDFSPVKDLVFAEMNLPPRDLATFTQLYDDLVGRIALPKLTIFLDVPLPELMRRIHERGRPYEMGMSEEYIRRLRDHYERRMDRLGEKVHCLEVTPGESRDSVVARVVAIARQELASDLRPGDAG